MIPVNNQFHNSSIYFETYTKFTEDYKTIENLVQQDGVLEIVAIKDAYDKEYIFLNTSWGIYCMEIKEGEHTYSATLIDMKGENMKVFLENGEIVVFVKENSELWYSKRLNGTFIKKTKYPYYVPDSLNFVWDEEQYVLATDYMRRKNLGGMILRGHETNAALGRQDGFIHVYTDTKAQINYEYHRFPHQKTSFCSSFLALENTYFMYQSYRIEGEEDMYYTYGSILNPNDWSECYIKNIDKSVKGFNCICAVYGHPSFPLIWYSLEDGTINIAQLTYERFKPVQIETAVTMLSFSDSFRVIGTKIMPTDKYFKTELHVICYTEEEGLMHLHLEHQSRTGEQYKLKNISTIAPHSDAYELLGYSNDLVIYYKDYDKWGKMSIRRLEYDFEEEKWTEYNFLALCGSGFTSISCYTTEMTFYDTIKDRIPKQGLEVTVKAEDNIMVDTSVGMKEIGKDVPVKLTTDGFGKIYITQYCDEIYAVPITVECPDIFSEDKALEIHQYERIKDEISKFSASDFIEAKKMDGEKPDEDSPLVPLQAGQTEKEREENCQNLHMAVQELLKEMKQGNNSPVNYGVYLKDKNEKSQQNYNWHSGYESHWSFTTEGNNAVFKRLSREEAEQEIVLLKSQAQDGSFFSFLKSIGDFIVSVAKKIFQVVKTIVSGVKKTFGFIFNGILHWVEFIFDPLIKLVNRVLDCIAVVFSQVFVFFADIVLWLAFRIRWSDVIRTKNAVRDAANAVLEILPEFILKFEGKAVSAIQDTKLKILAGLDTLKSAQTLGEVGKVDQDTDTAYAMSNNMMMRNYTQLQNGEGISIDLTSSLSDTVFLDKPFKLLQDFCEKAGKTEGVEELKNFLSKYMSNPFQISMDTFVELISVLVKALFDMSIVVVKAMFEIIAELFRELKTLFNTPIQVPFFSSFFKGISGNSDLTINELSSLLIGFTASVVYGIGNRKPIFANNTEAENFVKDVRSSFSGFYDKNIPAHYVETIGVINCAAGIVSTASCFVSDTLDFMGEPGAKKEKENWQNALTLFGGITCGSTMVWLITDIPYLNNPEEQVNIETPEIVGWGYFMVGFVIDSLIFIADTKLGLGKTASKIVKVYTMFYGLGHAGITGYRIACTKDFHWASGMAEIGCSAKEIITILLLSKNPYCFLFYTGISAVNLFTLPAAYIIEAFDQQ